MCLGFDMQTIQPPTAKAKLIVKRLRLLLILSAVLAILYMFFVSVFSGMFKLIFLMLLYMTYSSISYCLCILCFFLKFFDIISGINMLGTMIQNKIPFAPSTKYTMKHMLIICSIIMAIVLAYYLFLAYKEFKAIAQEFGASNQMSFLNSGNNANYNDNNYQNYQYQQYEMYNPNNQNQQYQQFENDHSPNQSSNQRGNYFTGQGVRIG